MIKIEFPVDRTDIALAIGQALINIGSANSLTELKDYCDAEVKEETASIKDARPSDVREAERAELYKHTDGPAESSKNCLRGWLAYKHTDEPAEGETVTRADSHGTYEHTGAAKAQDMYDEQADIKIEEDARGSLDENGVEFDKTMCADAAIPFYASGKTQGQWKKKKGVTQDAYDLWYANAHKASAPVIEEKEIDTSAAFGAVTTSDEGPKFADFGAFMVWFSEQQAAGTLNEDDMKDAYSDTSVNLTELVTDPASAPEKLQKLYDWLTAP